MGGFLVALSTFQGEFDFGVPQFRLVLHPTLIMLAAGIGLVTARLYLGRGGALLAVAGFLVIRGFLALTVGVVFGQTTPHFPLYIVEALLVELVFLRATAAPRRSPPARWRVSPSGRSAWAPSGAGRTSGCPSPGRRRCCRRPPWPACWPPSPVVPWAASWAPRWCARAPFPPLRAERLAALAAGVVLMAVIAWGLPLSTDGPRNAERDPPDVPGRTAGAR